MYDNILCILLFSTYLESMALFYLKIGDLNEKISV